MFFKIFHNDRKIKNQEQFDPFNLETHKKEISLFALSRLT